MNFSDKTYRLIKSKVILTIAGLFFISFSFAILSPAPTPAQAQGEIETPANFQPPTRSTRQSAVLNALYTSPEITDGWPVHLWTEFRTFVNGLFAVLVIAIAIANLFRINIDTYAIKKTLPMAVLALILANFSLVICRMIIDVAERISNYPNLFGLAIGNTIMTLTGPNTLLLTSGAIFLGPGVILFCGALAMAIVLWVILLIRPFILWVLTAVSPIAFLCMAFPATLPLFKKWIGTFIAWSFSIVVVVFLMGIASYANTIPGGTGNLNVLVSIPVLLLKIGILALACTAPFKMGGALGSFLWAKAGQPATEALKNYGHEKQQGFSIMNMKGATNLGNAWSKEKGLKGLASSGLKAFGRYGNLEMVGEGMAMQRKTELERERGQVVGYGQAGAAGLGSGLRTAWKGIRGQNPDIQGLGQSINAGYQKGTQRARKDENLIRSTRYEQLMNENNLDEVDTSGLTNNITNAINSHDVEIALLNIFAKAARGEVIDNDVARLEQMEWEDKKGKKHHAFDNPEYLATARQAVVRSARVSGRPLATDHEVMDAQGQAVSVEKQTRQGRDGMAWVASLHNAEDKYQHLVNFRDTLFEIDDAGNKVMRDFGKFTPMVLAQLNEVMNNQGFDGVRNYFGADFQQALDQQTSRFSYNPPANAQQIGALDLSGQANSPELNLAFEQVLHGARVNLPNATPQMNLTHENVVKQKLDDKSFRNDLIDKVDKYLQASQLSKDDPDSKKLKRLLANAQNWNKSK